MTAEQLRARIAQLEADQPQQLEAADLAAAELETAQRAGNLAAVITAQARAAAALGIAQRTAADLAADRERLAQLEADQASAERQQRARAAELLAERLAAEIDQARASTSRQYARLLGLEQLHAQAERQVRAELGREVAQPARRSGFFVALANISHPVAKLDPETLAALE